MLFIIETLIWEQKLIISPGLLSLLEGDVDSYCPELNTGVPV
jgi:hypothetical protein